jgi:hypothetical protein
MRKNDEKNENKEMKENGRLRQLNGIKKMN